MRKGERGCGKNYGQDSDVESEGEGDREGSEGDDDGIEAG